MKTDVIIRDIGITDYAECLALQEDLCARRLADQISNTVLLTEHRPVITLGARKADNKLLCNPSELAEQGIALCTAGRGGAATAHNPGQIVIYPIIKLKTLGLGLSEYVHTLGTMGRKFLAELGIHALWKKETPGLWIENRKIASIGVQAKKWVTLHGIAINIDNDLSIFRAIVPCGLENIEITSVKREIGQSPTIAQVKERLSELCKNHFCAEPAIHD